MRIGTPGFNGARLREAREVRGVSAVSLSETASVSTQQIYNYENGKSSPSPEALEKLSNAINLPVEFFLRETRGPSRDTIFYRSMSSATKGARARAERRLQWLQDLACYVTTEVALPKVNLPDFSVPTDPLLLADQDIENLAEEVRHYWGMRDGPIANMVLLLENQGVVVARDQLGAETLDSLSVRDSKDDRPYIGIGTDKGTPARWRFDAAHELGHLILHSSLDRSLLNKAAQFKRIEEQAHRFASAFLVPLGPFSDDLFGMSLDSLRAVKPKWNVSIAMMIIRSRQAGLLNEDQERKLWINYNRRKWRKNEPYDDSMNVEEPRMLRRSFEIILSEGDQTPDDVVKRLALPPLDIEALAGLPENFLQTFSRVESSRGAAASSGNVVNLASARGAAWRSTQTGRS